MAEVNETTGLEEFIAKFVDQKMDTMLMRVDQDIDMDSEVKRRKSGQARWSIKNRRIRLEACVDDFGNVTEDPDAARRCFGHHWEDRMPEKIIDANAATEAR